VILSPSKYFPLTATHLCQRLIQLSKHFWNFIVSIAIRAVFDFFITSFRQLKRVPRNGFLTRSNRKKSQGAISGEFDGCWMIFVSFLVKNSRIMMALCVIMVQNPRVVYPQILSFLANCFTQTSHNTQIILLINCLTFWQKFVMYNTL